MPVWFAMAIALVLTSGALAPSAGAREADQKIEVPAWLAERLGALSDEQRAFLLSDEAEGFTGTREKLYQRLKDKTPEEIAAYVDGMMTVVQARKFNPATDMAAIPLNTESPEFNSWKVRKPASFNPKREPGPFTLSYYASNRPGIRTFANAPVAIYPEDLVAGQVDIAIVGAPLDMGSYYRGQRFGPQAMRNEYGAGGIDMNTMVNPTKELNIVDYGDIAVDNMSTEITVHRVRERVAALASTGALPLIVGGDTRIEYQHIA